MLVNVLSTVTINELVGLKIINIREYKFQHCDLSSCMSGKNKVFASSETYVATSSLTRRCSKDQKPCHNVVLRHWIKAEWKLTLLIPSVRLKLTVVELVAWYNICKRTLFQFQRSSFLEIKFNGLKLTHSFLERKVNVLCFSCQMFVPVHQSYWYKAAHKLPGLYWVRCKQLLSLLFLL